MYDIQQLGELAGGVRGSVIIRPRVGQSTSYQLVSHAEYGLALALVSQMDGDTERSTLVSQTDELLDQLCASASWIAEVDLELHWGDRQRLRITRRPALRD